MITQPPEKVTAALGTNATFSCCGNGDVFWKINGIQVTTEQLVQNFAELGVYVPLPAPSVSELIMTATEMNNSSRIIQCLVVQEGNVAVKPNESDCVHLIVFGE